MCLFTITKQFMSLNLEHFSEPFPKLPQKKICIYFNVTLLLKLSKKFVPAAAAATRPAGSGLSGAAQVPGAERRPRRPTRAAPAGAAPSGAAPRNGRIGARPRVPVRTWRGGAGGGCVGLPPRRHVPSAPPPPSGASSAAAGGEEKHPRARPDPTRGGRAGSRHLLSPPVP